LPKVLSSYPLSPQRGERVRVREGAEKTFGNQYKPPADQIKKNNKKYSNHFNKLSLHLPATGVDTFFFFLVG
jgi:uncharacterized C2H2 Zn-finger protein